MRPWTLLTLGGCSPAEPLAFQSVYKCSTFSLKRHYPSCFFYRNLYAFLLVLKGGCRVSLVQRWSAGMRGGYAQKTHCAQRRGGAGAFLGGTDPGPAVGACTGTKWACIALYSAFFAREVSR